MQSIAVNGQVTLINAGLRTVMSLQDSFNTTGSNSISNNQNITTAGWSLLNQGSNNDFRLGYFANLGLTSSIQIAINEDTSSYCAWLQPGDVAVIPNSGSVNLYAKAYGAETPVILQYLLSEA